MQAELQNSFQRVEQALQRLTDSIAAYNPDVKAAEELGAADGALSEDLKRLVTHQRNHARKETLRRRTDALDADIKGRIRAIADARKSLAGIPPYSAAEGATREIDVQELLRYAKVISKTTVPPTLPKTEGKKEEQEGMTAQLANGTATSPPPQPPADTHTHPHEGPAAAELPEGSQLANAKYLTRDQRAWIGQQLHFEPWPEHMTIARGALGNIQRMVDDGRDPAGVLSREEQAEVERVRALEEEETERRERAEKEEREKRWGAGTGGGGGGRREAEEEVVFDPDEI